MSFWSFIDNLFALEEIQYFMNLYGKNYKRKKKINKDV